MTKQSSHNPDKTIVERRDAHKNDKSRQAVKNLRAGIKTGGADQPGEPHKSFETDVLLKHARSLPLFTTANLIVGCLAWFACYMHMNHLVANVWLTALVLLSGLTLLAGRRYKSASVGKNQVNNWQLTFRALSFAYGLTWVSAFGMFAYFAPENISLPLVFASGLLITVLSFASFRFVKNGVILAAVPLTAAVSIWLAIDGQILSLAFASLLIVFNVYFQWFGGVLRESHADFLTSKAERDELIMELNASRAISDEARRRAEDANLAKSRFLATMSHELRTPLNAILGFSEVMSNEVMGPLNNDYYKEYVGDIHRSGTHLLNLINEILDLSRVEAGRYELNEEATNLAHAAEESFQMVKLKASDKSVNLNMQVQPDLPQIWADARAVRQVILNLLSNALKFTPTGGSINMKVGWTAGGGQYVSIRDTGPGIPEDEIPIVLSSFGQGSIAIKSAEQGTGLGLPIVQALVHMHDGKFELKSKLREGTEVIATFPRARVMEELSAVAMEENVSDPRVGRKFNQQSQRQKINAPSMAAIS